MVNNSSNEFIDFKQGSLEIDFSLSPFVSPGTTGIFSISASLGGILNSPSISYQWEIDGEELRDGENYETKTHELTLSVSGSKTNELTITSYVPGEFSIRCKVTAPGSCNSSVYSNYVMYRVSPPRSIVQMEAYNTSGNTSRLAILKEYNLDNQELVIQSDEFGNNYSLHRGIKTSLGSDMICLFAEEKDLEVEAEMYGSKGSDFGSKIGGEGGYSKIRFTMFKGEEYILKGINSPGALYLYRKSNLIACVAAGGYAGKNKNGEPGGGCNVKGGGTQSSSLPINQELNDVGIFGSSSNQTLIYAGDSKSTGTRGGRTIKCPKGVYWKNQGKSSCEDLGETNFRLSDGTIVLNSAVLKRGYKDGYGINQTGGQSDSTGGNGGDGVFGGDGGIDGNGGSGGSGYFLKRSSTVQNGLEVERGDLVDDSILGGSTFSKPKFILRFSSPIETKGRVTHSFNNSSNINLLLESTGCIEKAATESMGAADGLFGFGGNFSGKHYTIVLNVDYSNIVVVPSQYTGGGRFDPGIRVDRIVKMEQPFTYKVWFRRGGGENTYVSYFDVQGQL